ncbi:ferredoxin reductase-like protein [Aspergillus steynii IBT 23096]|uniref:NADH-cytochrome b5 reductase n=1 Tax=Aspergillus steynii IBT 23096 TaxID=1392250 RepID=A0A2I2GAZ6_9EURO|nr:ferredoxin reductase-like protein [Aspergillus steynii IBT 23096]PLB50040.1 ferredoxin reductase-like protein [Aspergillus steynii IBT 23096]
MSSSRFLPKSLKTTAVVSAFALLGVGTYSYARSTPTAHAEDPDPPMIFSGFGPTTLRLQSVKMVNHNTKRLVFEFPDKNARSGLSLTSALLTISRPSGQWLPVLRPYTPISNLDEKGSLELLVKHYPSGKASTHLHSLVPGDTLTFATALRGFPWTPNQFSHVYLIAGGAGITPLYQLLQGILTNPDDKTKVNLVFGVNTEQDLLLREELEGFKRRFPDRFGFVYTVSRGGGLGEGVRKGHVTEELLREVIGEKKGDAKVFVCGPPGMEEALVGSRKGEGILGRLGFAKEQVYRF